MDDVDRQLLTILQRDIPLKTKPFGLIAKKISIDEAEVLFRIQRLIDDGIIRYVAGIFDARALGYKSARVAMRFKPGQTDPAAEIIHAHPGVFYSSRREHEFNFWFLIAAGPGDRLEEHVRKLEALAGAVKTLIFPVLKSFKGTGLEEWGSLNAEPPLVLVPGERSAIRKLQQDFPLTDEPFLRIAAELGISEPGLFQMIQSFRERGFLRRIGGLLEDAAPKGDEPWAVWQVPEEKMDRAGNEISGWAAVESCTRRPDYPDFPYSLHAVLKTRKAEETEDLMRDLEKQIGPWPRQILLPAGECKKKQLKFFTPEFEAWNRENGLCLVGSE